MEYLSEMESSIAFLTETWLHDSPELDEDIKDMELESGYSMIYKNRQLNPRGYTTGGVAIAFKRSHIELKTIDLPGNNYEIIFAEGSIPRFTRKFLAICVYMPPNLSASSARECLNFLVDAILELKQRYNDPFITIAGDFNNFGIHSALEDY